VHSPHQQDSSFTMNTNANSSAPPSTSPGLTNADCANFIKKQAMSAEIFHGIPLNNEYELIPFNHFTYSRVYPIELGLGKRVVEKPIGFKRKDLLESLMKAIETLNKNVTEKLNKYTLDDFLEGLYRSEPTTGTQYELYFRTKIAKKSAQGGFRKVVVFRPFAPVQTITTEVLSGDGTVTAWCRVVTFFLQVLATKSSSTSFSPCRGAPPPSRASWTSSSRSG
jgi:chondroitin sulfate N-acetylgalactosaminyltransferase 1/2